MKIETLRRLGAVLAVPALAAAALLMPGCSKPAETKQAEAPAEKAPAAPESTPGATASDTADDNAVLAVVNGQKITQADVNAEFEKKLQSLGPQMAAIPPQQLEKFRAQATPEIVDFLITRALITKAADEAGDQPSAEDINKAIEQFRASIPPDHTFEEALKQAGVTEEQFRTELAQQMAVKKLLEVEAEKAAKPDEAAVEAFYKENKDKLFVKPESVEASHILVSVPEGATDEQKKEAKAKADKVRKQLVKSKGKDFAELAKENSDCPSKANGGSLGTFSKGQMVKPFEEAAFSQKPGEVGEVIETPFGYHIIMVAAHNKSEEVPLNEVKDRIEQHLQMQNQEKVVTEYIDSLKAKANITYPEGSPAAPAAAPAPEAAATPAS